MIHPPEFVSSCDKSSTRAICRNLTGSQKRLEMRFISQLSNNPKDLNIHWWLGYWGTGYGDGVDGDDCDVPGDGVGAGGD